MRNRIRSLVVAMVFVPSIFAANVPASQASGARAETDRPWYLAGEAMTVSIAADHAMIAYVELCDTHGLVAGTMVSLKGGEGTGLISIADTMHCQSIPVTTPMCAASSLLSSIPFASVWMTISNGSESHIPTL